MKQKTKQAPELQRSMTAGQMEMISLGGAIGLGCLWAQLQPLNGLVRLYFWLTCL